MSNRNMIVSNRFRNSNEIEKLGIDHVKFSSYDMLFLAAVQEYKRLGKLDNTIPTYITFTFEMLFKDMNISSHNVTKDLIDSFYKLVEIDEIEWLNKEEVSVINKNTVLHIRIKVYEKNFTTVKLSLVQEIIYKVDLDIRKKRNYLYILITLVSYRGNNNYCYPTQEAISETVGIEPNAVLANLKELREMGIVDYKNIGDILVGKGIARQSANTYVIKDTKDFRKVLDDVIEYTKKKFGIDEVKNSNEKRSATQHMNNLRKKYPDITEEEKTLLLELEQDYYIRTYNNSVKKGYEFPEGVIEKFVFPMDQIITKED